MDSQSSSSIQLERRLIQLANCWDPRLRVAAVGQLAKMSQCKGKGGLSLQSYKALAELCSNSHTTVRLMALGIVGEIAERYPNE